MDPVLVFKYGFLIVFACSASTLIFWVVRRLVLNLVRSSNQKDVLITNHIAHLTDAVLKSNEKIDNFRLDLNDGFDRLVTTFENGLDRQARSFDKVLERTLPPAKNE